jgi:uncharacterized membrane protein YfcA
VGLTAGCLTSAFSSGGPPLLVYARESGWESEPARFRANLQIAFMSMNVLTISLYAWRGLLTTSTLWVTMSLLPGAAVGVMLGTVAAGYVNKEQFRVLVLAGLTVIGVVYTVRGGIYVGEVFKLWPHA